MKDLPADELKTSLAPADLTPNGELASAVAKLNAFTQKSQEGALSNVHYFDFKDAPFPVLTSSAFKQTMSLVRYFITSTFSEKSRDSLRIKKILVQKEVSRAIDTLKSHYLIIQKFKKGTPPQQQLAAAAISAIHHYNDVMERQKKEHSHWRQKVIRFLYKKSGLAIEEDFFEQKIHPPVSAMAYVEIKKFGQLSDSSAAGAASQKISSYLTSQPPQNTLENITEREADAFRVKANSLLKSHGIRFLSLSEQLHSIKVTPIEARANHSSNLVSMSQILKPFPGETIVLKGLFKREEENPSIPIPESFEVSSAAEQNGYPHPSQHTGWALSDVLIPYCPLKMDQLPTFYHVYREKARIAKELLPQGEFNLKAKEILKVKKDLFESNKEELLLLHQEFHLALLTLVPALESVKDAKEKITLFFDTLPSINLLSDIYDTLITQFILQPYQTLQDDWFEYKHPQLLHKESRARLQAALSILNKSFQQALDALYLQKEQCKVPHEQRALDFIVCVASLLAPPCYQIILQYLSEIMSFPPPMLNDYEMRIQALAYKQLLEFHAQITSPLDIQEVLSSLKKQLISDSDLLKLSNTEKLPPSLLILINEMEVYYNSQFYSSLQN